ncbi:MAG: carboxynorspermidine decarboxylase [Fibromonadales bacterium]|nr:carboxynorspermidine decarboxylase [Fibromonadales bacterium]MCL1957701.1 carboxynorspermidine decarboxylase [Fibromonadales bacterium]
MIDYSAVPSPCYVLEESRLLRNLEMLSKVQKKGNAKVICALKGFSFWKTFHLVSKHLNGATASSLNEVLLAHQKMGKEVHVCAPAYMANEIKTILSYASHITFNSFSQWNLYKKETLKKKVSAGIRINPEYSNVDVDLYNPTGRYSRLGVTRQEFKPELLDGIEGLHFHALCEQNADALEDVLEKVYYSFGEWIPKMKWVNFGGGHHITRADYDVERLINILNKFHKKYPGVEVILEPGEAVGWQTGELVSTVLDIVRNEIDIAILDVSITAHMPDCLEMPYRPMVLNSDMIWIKPYTYRLAGNSCLAGDVAGDYSFDKPLKIGSKIIFLDMMHYTMVKTTFFNGVKHPSIGIWKDNKFNLVKKFSYESFRDKLS